MPSASPTDADNSTPNFGILQAAALKTCFDVMNEDFEPVEEQQEMGDIFHNTIQPQISIPETTERVIIGAYMEWIKAACGSFTIGIRLESEGGKNSTTTMIGLFGGTDSDRLCAGDTTFWEVMRENAPSITATQWTEFVESGDLPGLVVSVEEPCSEEEDEDEDDDEWQPHAAFPNIFHSALLLTLAEKLLGNAVSLGPEASTWKFGGPCDDIEASDGEKMKGHVWSRHQHSAASPTSVLQSDVVKALEADKKKRGATENEKDVVATGEEAKKSRAS